MSDQESTIRLGAGKEKKHRAFGPDAIRATAITCVLLAHTIPGGLMVPEIGAFRYYIGFLGVEIFFLLSGYLIGGMLMAELFSGQLDSLAGVATFWKRRWFRTLPNYYLFLLIIFLLTRPLKGQFPTGVVSYLWFGQALTWPYPDFFAAAWSLAIEEWFYLLFPLVLFVLCRLITNRKVALLSTIVLFLVVPLTVRACMSPMTGWDDGIRRVTLPRLDAIGYGVVLAYLKGYWPAMWKFMLKLWPLGALATLGILIQFGYHFHVAGYWTSESVIYRAFYFPILATSLALLFPKVADMAQPAHWAGMAIQKMSLWSYAMYLNHLVVLGVIDLTLKYFGATYNQAHIWRAILLWLLIIPTSAMIYRFYEKPLMDLRDRPLRSFFRRSRDSQVKPATDP